MAAQTSDKMQQLISYAISQREWRRSGKSLAMAIVVFGILVGIGLLMILAVNPDHPGALVFGIIAFMIAALVLSAMFRSFNPASPWGTAVPGNCPRCGQPNLREKKITLDQGNKRFHTTWSGIVTLCTPECGFARVRP